MGLTTLIFGEPRSDVVGYDLSVADLARTHLPDSKLSKITAEFARTIPIGQVRYSFEYNRDTIVPLEDGHEGPYLVLTSHQWQPPLFAHAFKPAYASDVDEVATVMAELTGGALVIRNDYEMEVGGKRMLIFFRYVVLPRQLTREDFKRLFGESRLRAENPRIKFISFVDATRSEYQFQVEHESKFHW